MSVPFTIDVTPCSPATLRVVSTPEDVILPLSRVYQNLVRIDVDEIYKPMFVSSIPAQCPILTMEALNADDSAFSSSFVAFVNMNDGNYFLEVTNTAANIKRVQIKACIFTQCKSIFFNVRVCGAEQL